MKSKNLKVKLEPLIVFEKEDYRLTDLGFYCSVKYTIQETNDQIIDIISCFILSRDTAIQVSALLQELSNRYLVLVFELLLAITLRISSPSRESKFSFYAKLPKQLTFLTPCYGHIWDKR